MQVRFCLTGGGDDFLKLGSDIMGVMTPIFSTGSLPAPLQPLTPLIGRDQELTQVVGMLARGEVRLLTLVGPGGTGKTRLALAVAAASGAVFDEIVVVALAAISDPELVVDAIAQTLGVGDAGDTPQETQLMERLSGQKRLLVLDNFEQIMEAAPKIVRLLGACPQLKALVTSREPLHLYGEYEFPVPPMSLPDIERLPDLEGLAQYEAVRLFIERAVAVQPSFSVTNATAPAVAAICHKLDGLPLAIELAAARVKHMAPVVLLARLEKRLN
ncbi:MAG: AAA family ATPase, partial [Chloroflexia bacterium]